VRVPDREVVKSSGLGRLTGDWEVGRITFDVKGGTVHEPDADARVTVPAQRERHREILVPRRRCTRSRVDNSVMGELELKALSVNDLDPLGQGAAKGWFSL
jgi:hypothetical protein